VHLEVREIAILIIFDLDHALQSGKQCHKWISHTDEPLTRDITYDEYFKIFCGTYFGHFWLYFDLDLEISM